MSAKRVFDLALATVLLLAMAPFLGAIAVGVKLASPGPVLYCGWRTGRHGRLFQILKFRTMRPDAEATGGGTTALHDPRVHRFGRFLRRYKLDELPQLVNVLRGEMSFVGPRPELPLYTSRYSQEEQLILTVRPGITDYSSLRFSSLDEWVGAVDADCVFEEKVLPEKNRLRLEYVRHYSFVGDLKIIGLTLWCIIRKIFN